MMQYNILSCLNYQHNQQKITHLCIDSHCNKSRLVCPECVTDHNHAPSLRTYDQLIKEISKNLSTESDLAKFALNKYNEVKEKLIKQLNLIEMELKKVCQIRIPNESAQELLDFIKKQESSSQELNEKIINYVKTTTDEQLQKQKAQRDLSTDNLCKFSQKIKNYLNKLDQWLKQMPEIVFKPQTQQALAKLAQDLGTQYYNKISTEKCLIQQFSVKYPVRLNEIKHGRIEGHDQSLVYFNFYLGTQLESPFYKYSVKIEQMDKGPIVDQRSPNKFITKLDPPIYLYPKMKYCISINSLDKLQILDFSQQLHEGPDQNFQFHLLPQIPRIFTRRYFILEFTYDLIQIP